MGFLRGDHTFLSQAFRHPTTSFLLLKDLQPLISDKTKLAYVKLEDIQAITGDDPYAQNEEEFAAMYNSTKHIPQMIFLGVDEQTKGLEYENKKNVYKGAPYFALDVTPRGSVADACNKLVSSLESRGLSFAQGRAMDLQASDGTQYVPPASFHRQDRITNSTAFYADSS